MSVKKKREANIFPIFKMYKERKITSQNCWVNKSHLAGYKLSFMIYKAFMDHACL